MFEIILLSCFSPLSFAQVNNNYNTRGIQKLHKINYKTPTTITIIKSISTALQFSAMHVWVVHVYVCKCTCISHRIMHGIIIICKVMSYSAKFLRAVNFTDFASFPSKCENYFCKTEQTASHVAKLRTVYWVYF